MLRPISLSTSPASFSIISRRRVAMPASPCGAVIAAIAAGSRFLCAVGLQRRHSSRRRPAAFRAPAFPPRLREAVKVAVVLRQTIHIAKVIRVHQPAQFLLYLVLAGKDSESARTRYLLFRNSGRRRNCVRRVCGSRDGVVHFPDQIEQQPKQPVANDLDAGNTGCPRRVGVAMPVALPQIVQ